MEGRNVVERERSRLSQDAFWWKSLNDLLTDWMLRERKNSILPPWVCGPRGQADVEPLVHMRKTRKGISTIDILSYVTSFMSPSNLPWYLFFIPILQKRKLRLSEMKLLIQAYTGLGGNRMGRLYPGDSQIKCWRLQTQVKQPRFKPASVSMQPSASLFSFLYL